jgi:hypothetical protein
MKQKKQTMIFKSFYFTVWLCISVFLSFSSKAVDCSTDTSGLCTPTVEEIIDEVITETIDHQVDGILTITTTDTTTTTTTVANEESGNILDSNNDFVTSSKDGEMNIDWGGQGPASMRSGSYCNELGTDRCAEITGSGNSTSTMGVQGMGTTFIQTVNIQDLNIQYGGEVKYSIEDSEDSVYMHITGKDGSTNVFSGTDILSASGTTSGFQIYENTFDFGGKLTTITVEVGGRDVGVSVGVLFDSVRIDVFYNTIVEIINQTITSVEMFIAFNSDATEEIINVVENIFDTNAPVQTDEGFSFEPIVVEDISYETVEIEIDYEMDFDMDFELPNIDIEEIEVTTIEMELEMEMDFDMPELDLPEPEIEVAEVEMQEPEVETDVVDDIETPEVEEVQDEPIEETTEEPDNDIQEETENEESISEVEENEDSQEDMDEPKDKVEEKKVVETKQNKKEQAAKKIVKKMGDKGKYDSVNQTKTLLVMQVLGNSKTFFDSQKQINDTVGFFTDKTLPDTIINDNNLASYFLFVGSDGLMNEIIESQYETK